MTADHETLRWVTCDCGQRHEVPEYLIGTTQWWLCMTCLDEAHERFESWFALARRAAVLDTIPTEED